MALLILKYSDSCFTRAKLYLRLTQLRTQQKRLWKLIYADTWLQGRWFLFLTLIDKFSFCSFRISGFTMFVFFLSFLFAFNQIEYKYSECKKREIVLFSFWQWKRKMNWNYSTWTIFILGKGNSETIVLHQVCLIVYQCLQGLRVDHNALCSSIGRVAFSHPDIANRCSIDPSWNETSKRKLCIIPSCCCF